MCTITPVETVLVLLRPKAQASDQTGVHRRLAPNGNLISEFHYRIERVWERSVDYWLQSGLGLAPLALLTDEANVEMESSLDRLRESLEERNLDDRTLKSLLGSTYVLCGLRHDKVRIESLFRRLSMLMEESTTYQAILEEGREKGLSQGLSQGLRRTLHRLGSKKFGPPTPEVATELQRVNDVARLELLTDRILDVTSWDELFSTS
jgi:predicted transposase YdaD